MLVYNGACAGPAPAPPAMNPPALRHPWRLAIAYALAALLILGERLSWVEIVAMACVIVASIGSTRALAKAPVVNE